MKKLTDSDVETFFVSYTGGVRMRIDGTWLKIPPSDNTDELVRALKLNQGVEFTLGANNVVGPVKIDKFKYVDKSLLSGIKKLMGGK